MVRKDELWVVDTGTLIFWRHITVKDAFWKEALLALDDASTLIFYMSLRYEILQFSKSPLVHALLKSRFSSATFCVVLESQNSIPQAAVHRPQNWPQQRGDYLAPLHKCLSDQPAMHVMTWEPGGNNSGFSRQMWFEFIKSFWNFLIWKECQCRQMKHFRPNCSSLLCAMANSFPTIHCLSLLYKLPDPRTSNFQDSASSRFYHSGFLF